MHVPVSAGSLDSLVMHNRESFCHICISPMKASTGSFDSLLMHKRESFFHICISPMNASTGSFDSLLMHKRKSFCRFCISPIYTCINREFWLPGDACIRESFCHFCISPMHASTASWCVIPGSSNLNILEKIQQNLKSSLSISNGTCVLCKKDSYWVHTYRISIRDDLRGGGGEKNAWW